MIRFEVHVYKMCSLQFCKSGWFSCLFIAGTTLTTKFYYKDWGSKDLWDVGILPQH